MTYLRLMMILIVMIMTSSCGNVFTSFSEEGTDAALTFDAQTALDNKDYALAIAIIESMSPEAQADRSVRVLKASAHGGLCGVEFLTLLDSVANGGSDRFFVTLMKAMSSATSTKQASCEAAIDEVRLISATAADRTSDENMLMTVLALGTIGTILHKNADTDSNNAVDAGFNHCTTTSDADLNRLVASMAETFASLQAVGSSTIASTDMSSLTSACTSLASQTPPLDFCSKTDPTTVTSDERKGMKGVVGSDQSIGLGSCSGSVIVCALASGC